MKKKCDMWHVTHDTWHMTGGERWTFPQSFSSLALTVWEWRCFKDIFTKYDLVIMRPGVAGAVLQTALSFIKQGSSENDVRSDVYDRSDFKVIFNCCYNQQLLSHQLQSFYLYLPEFFQNLPEVTIIYLNLHIFT